MPKAEAMAVIANVNIHLQSIVATTMYPDFGPLFLVSTRWCNIRGELAHDTYEIRVFAGIQLKQVLKPDPAHGHCVYWSEIHHWKDAEEMHQAVCDMLMRGAVTLKRRKE